MPINHAELTLESINSFSTLCRTLPGLMKTIQDEVDQCQDAIMDIEHYIEINKDKVDRTPSNQLLKLIRQYRIQRRKGKDTLAVIRPVLAFVEKYKGVWGDLDRARGEAKKEAQKVSGPRQYNPRVLHELFGTDKPDTTLSLAMQKGAVKT